MKTKLVGPLAAGVLSSVLIGQAAQGQMQSGLGSTGGNTGTNSAGGQSTPPGARSTPGGLSLQTMDFTQGTTSSGGTGSGTTGTGAYGNSRNSRRTGSRNGTSLGGLSGLSGLQGGNLGNAGRGNTSGMQNNRQTERRAQYSTRVDLTSASQELAAPGSSAGSTLQVRTSVERSITSIVPTGTSVSMDGSNAILSGIVASEHDRLLVERMALLVPGVQSVRNELLVQGKVPAKL